MPCQDPYNDRIQCIERKIEIDKPETLRKLVNLEVMLCNVGFILRNNPNIKGNKKQISEILKWHESHRIEELIIILERNKEIYNEMVFSVRSIRELGEEPKPKMIKGMKKAWAEIKTLEKKIRSKDESLLYSRKSDCSLEIKKIFNQ